MSHDPRATSIEPRVAASRIGRLLALAASAPAKALAGVGAAAGRVVGGFLGAVEHQRQLTLSGANPYHDAARRDSTTADWRRRLSSADQAILEDLDTVLAGARMAVVNDPWAASVQGGFARTVIGGGITARSAAAHPRTGERLDGTEGHPGFNQIRDALWQERISTPKLIDAEETKTMAEKQRLWMNELVVAGGVFVLEAYRPVDEAVRLQLQEIEYEQRDLTRNVGPDGRSLVRGGIEVGEYGQPRAYYLYTQGHPLDWSTMGQALLQGERIDADRCHHLYRQDRVRQRIGISWLAPVLARMRQLAMYEQYTLLQARTRAAFPGFIKQGIGGSPGAMPAAVARSLGLPSSPEQAASDAADGVLHVNLAPGSFPILKSGQEPFFPTPGTPDPMYPQFVAEQLKGIAAATGLDFPTVTRWYADGNFSSQRQAKLDIQAEVDCIQDTLFIHRICERDLNRWLDLIVEEGWIRAPGYKSNPAWRAAYRKTNWQGPPRQSIDEIKDEAAWDLRIKAGRASPQEYFNAYGKDMGQVLSEIQEFRRAAAARGCQDIVDQWLGTFVAQTPAEGMAPDNAPANPFRGSGPGPNGGAAALAGRGRGGNSLPELVVRQHVLQSMLDGGNGNGNGHNGNGRH